LKPAQIARSIEANKIIHTFALYLTFVWHRNRLCLLYNRPGYKLRTINVQVVKHSGALSINYHELGMGGTMALAVGQLARWIRGQTRLPLGVWAYWADKNVNLAKTNGLKMIQYLKDSSYNDGKYTKCVLCGIKEGYDWWCLDGLIGPCCSYGRCQK